MDRSDADLVTAARQSPGAGDEAFGELVRRYQRMVYALVLALVQPADADDVAQDAFLRAFRNLDLLADPAKFGVWLRRITFGVAIDRARAERARRNGGTAASWVNLSDADASQAIDESPSPLERIERAELGERVLAALDRMPARYRVPLTLYHIDGLSHAKVAHTLGIPEATVRSLVARARRRLSRLLADSPEVHDMAQPSRRERVSLDVLDESAPTTPRLLHVLNGDSVRYTLERSSIPGTFAPWADVLHEGPVPFETGTLAAREVRARFVASAGFVPYPDAMRISGAWDASLAAYPAYDEVVMWFEHDLFDQLLLVRHLAWFSRRELGRTALSLICIGEFPGFEPFHGLGQLDPEQLTSLLGTRTPVSREQIALGERVWRAFTAADPSSLDAIVQAGPGATSALPFLHGALRRLIEEYPAIGTGLPRTERHILELLSEGPRPPGQLFRDEQRLEERVYMGDSTFWTRLRTLARGPTSLVSLDVEPLVDDDEWLQRGTVSITDAGRDVLAGRADWIRANGFDRWIGGVHLSAAGGGDVAWRYDASARRLVHGPAGRAGRGRSRGSGPGI